MSTDPETLLRAQIRANPADITAWQGLADLAMSKNAPDTALMILNQAARQGLRAPGLTGRAAQAFVMKRDVPAAQRWFRQALEEGLAEMGLLITAGAFLFDAMDYPGAAEAIDRRSQLEPDRLVHRLDLASVHIAASHYAGALEVLDKSQDLWAHSGKDGQDAAVLRIVCQAQLGIWDDFLSVTDILSQRPPTDPDRQTWLFLLAYCPGISGADIAKLYADWGRALVAQTGSLPQNSQRFAHADRRIIGILSGELFDSSMRTFITGLLSALRSLGFRIHAYNTRPISDGASRDIGAGVDLLRDVSGLDIGALQDLIISDRVGTLIDAASLSQGGRPQLFASRAAPLQLIWLGTGFTSGLAAIDGFVGDPGLLPPAAETYFAEPNLLRLENGFGVWAPPASAGLPAPIGNADAPVTFICTARPVRFNDPLYAAWAAILAAVPGSRMILNCRGFADEGGRAMVASRFGQALDRAGVGRDRVILMEQSPPWDSYRQADIALDPFPHSAATTSLDALWLGLPVVTLADRPPAGRWAAAILRAIGREDWIATDVESYIAKAISLARDKMIRDSARRELRPALAASALLDPSAFAKSFKAEYQRICLEVLGHDGIDE